MEAGRFTPTQIAQMAASGDMSRFYNSRAWRRLSREVISEQHGECQLCRTRGRYARADLVHHVRPLRLFPALAYERYYTDSQGERRKQLIACCRDCHEEIHGRAERSRENQGKHAYSNAERW